MNTVVKLHATRSTNDFLRARFRESELNDLHTVYTTNQTQGKGQRGTTWQSEKGKNLLFSFIYHNDRQLSAFEINQWVTVHLAEFISQRFDMTAKIKWPNDIVSGGKKIAGVLIENLFAQGKIHHSIVGVGLNVNQINFDHLPYAGSIKLIKKTEIDFNTDTLIEKLMNYLGSNKDNVANLTETYRNNLLKINQTAKFIADNVEFEAVVVGCDPNGRLLLNQEGTLKAYDLKEIKWDYSSF